jgi:hypothetical protein
LGKVNAEILSKHFIAAIIKTVQYIRVNIPEINKVSTKKNQMEFVLFCFVFFGAGIKPRALHMLGKRSTTKLHPSPQMENLKGKIY